MHTTELTDVSLLALDLQNFRTIPQVSEVKAIHALVSIKTKGFWALAKSLLEDGYLPTENIIVMKDDEATLVVKEGNRRVAALKLILGLAPIGDLLVPGDLKAFLGAPSPEWRAANAHVPCTIYDASDKDRVDRIVSMTHGLAEDARRADWESIARARHARAASGVASPALDLVETFLSTSRDITENQQETWAGTFPLTVLAELLRLWSPRLGATSVQMLVDEYRAGSESRELVDRILRDIAEDRLGFKGVRGTGADDAGHYVYGLPQAVPTAAAAPTPGGTTASAASAPTATPPTSAAAASGQSGSSKTLSPATPSPVSAPSSPTPRKKPAVVASNDPKSVKRALRAFKPTGKGREKLVTLGDEIKKLDFDKNPHAFCFLLRSMFELSAKAYFSDHGISSKKSNGDDKKLVEVLREVAKHIVDSQPTKPDKQAMQKVLHGAMAHLGASDAILSVTSLNQLVHNPKFTISATDIAVVFNNVFPLLMEMNA